MSDSPDYSEALRETIKEAGIKRARAAALLRVSVHTLNSWLKPRTSKSSAPAPLWAVDLLRLRTGLPQHPLSVAEDERLRQTMAASDKN